MARNFYLCTIAFIGGIALGTFVQFDTAFVALIATIITGLLLLSRVVTLPTHATGLLLAGIFLLLAVMRTEVAWSGVGESPLALQVGQPIVLTGVVIREPDVRERSQQLYVSTNGETVLVIVDRYEPVAFGDRLSIEGTLTTPEAFTTDLGRTFDYPGYLLARGVEYQLRYPVIEVITGGEGGLIQTQLFKMKEIFMQSIGAVVPEPQAGLAIGLLLGVKQSLGESLEAAFRQSGIIHIVVLSGYNLMIVAGFVSLLLSHIAGLRVRVIVGIAALLAFATMVGWSATVARATVMAILSLLALMLGRQYLVLRALLFAAVVMLAWNPFLLVYDVGFQLSFLATLGLVLIAPHLEVGLLSKPFLVPVRQFLLATLAAQIAVTPLLLYHMGEVSLVAVATNLLVLPLVPGAMLLSFLTGLVGLLSPSIATILAYPTTLVLTYIIEQARLWSSIPYATLPVATFSFWWVVAAYVFLGGVWYRLSGRGVVAEAVLARSQEIETGTIDLSGWTIVSAASVRASLGAANVQQKTPPSGVSRHDTDDTPIFFR